MDAMPEEEGGGGRWERARRAPGSRRWLGPFLVIVVVPILIGAAVVLIAGRGVAFAAIRRLTAHKFPNVQWVSTADLARWREDAGRTQPLLLDARADIEYRVSQIRGAVHINPGRPSLRPLALGNRITIRGPCAHSWPGASDSWRIARRVKPRSSS